MFYLIYKKTILKKFKTKDEFGDFKSSNIIEYPMDLDIDKFIYYDGSFFLKEEFNNVIKKRYIKNLKEVYNNRKLFNEKIKYINSITSKNKLKLNQINYEQYNKLLENIDVIQEKTSKFFDEESSKIGNEKELKSIEYNKKKMYFKRDIHDMLEKYDANIILYFLSQTFDNNNTHIIFNKIYDLFKNLSSKIDPLYLNEFFDEYIELYFIGYNDLLLKIKYKNDNLKKLKKIFKRKNNVTKNI